jgi:hypothetical protein
MLLRRILAFNISLLWSSCFWVTYRGSKHSAPPELRARPEKTYFRTDFSLPKIEIQMRGVGLGGKNE